MLKALELAGFKSFADKTRLEFPPGITVVVGPNGSGKSNVVDAIKWVLGEQSIKSLRGKEMADVIFNGSPTRRGMNAAEVTLTFNNSNNLLAVDAPEVHITRRIYRSGEGEYLINRNPSRLRDIRELLTGTGLGTQAYSVIEQGKVDVLLQSTAKDRRMIFEEAAGISRFKLKKLEALRRLERVDQNLLRLSDIVDEVESRLRGVRAQAGKARRYKEYSDRLQGLRTQVGLVDWRRLSERLAGVEGELLDLAAQREAVLAAAESGETQVLALDLQVGEVNEEIRRVEALLAANRERIAAQEASIEHERVRGVDLDEEIERHRRQVVSLSARADDLQQQWRETSEAVETAEELHRKIAQRLVEGERALTELMSRLDQVRGEHEQHRAAQLEQMRNHAVLGNEISGLESQVANTSASRDRSRGRITDLDRQIAVVAAELDGFRQQRDELAANVQSHNELRQAAEQQLAEDQRELAIRNDELAALRQRQSAAAERAAVLEELVRRQEGVTAGVKEVLARAAGTEAGPLKSVLGLVADLLSVSVEMAPLIEVALGSAAQHIVARPDGDLLEFLGEHASRFAGRVGFVWHEDGRPRRESDFDLSGQPGVIGRGDRFVETQPEFEPLVTRLLGRTWIVERLEHALQFSAAHGNSLDFVTLAGDLRQADGTLVVGPTSASSVEPASASSVSPAEPRQGASGLISRRSQLRELNEQLAVLDGRITASVAAVNEMVTQIAERKTDVAHHAAAYRKAAELLAEHRLKLSAAEERRNQYQQQRAALEGEFRAASVQHDAAVGRLAEAREKRQRHEGGLVEMETRLAAFQQQLARLEGERQARSRDTTETKVELAKSEERLRGLHARLRQFDETRQERGRAINEGRQQLELCIQRAEASRWNILRAETELADLYLRKEASAAENVGFLNRREDLKQQRNQWNAEVQRARAKGRKVDEQIHAQDLAANEVRLERETLAARLRDDYGIELAELEHQPTDEEQREREEVQQEIEELRHKLNGLGHVNLDALEELESLETRFQTLSDQYRDLAGAKSALEKIIDRINTDSRRLFTETLQTVREHFQKLFRDLFGGGQGDIVLEEGVDILESGIEILARPPGKEPRNISLLSGGEKTLTCVALLLAMFRSRPSPFCVLDEVDAALDEANIDRFTKVLQEFLAWTQFIIVTHSKKTMTCADTIYGVTMQESGVSKQVSVRFEDVSEDGHISPERLAAAEKEGEKDSQAA
jgi:chromosome segregation protein